MISVAAHFDGNVFVPDEPVHLEPGQTVRVVVGPLNESLTSPVEPSATTKVTPAPRRFQPLDIQIAPELSHAIALEPEFNIEES